MRDQRRVIRQLRPRTGSYRLGLQARLTVGLPRRPGTHKIRWKVVRLRYHEAIESDQAAEAKKQTVKRLSDPCRTMGFLRVAPIDSRQKVAHLRRRDRHCFARNRWPDEPSSLESDLTIRPVSDDGFLEGCANRFQTKGSSSAPARSSLLRPQPMAR